MRWGAQDLLVWLLPALGVATWILWRLHVGRQRRLLRLAEAGALAHLAPERRPALTRRRLWLRTLAVLLLGVALGRPQWGFRWEEARRRGLDVLVVLDTSKSMLAPDIKPNRFQQAKWGVRDLVGKLKGDRVGLVSFAGSSFLQCPLTTDYAAFLMTLDDVYVGIIPRGGTAIAQALRTALDAFEKSPSAADRAMVLITDGEDHEGDPLELLDELKEKNIRVYAVGVGTTEGELIPLPEGSAEGAFLKDNTGRVVKSALREDVLQRLSMETGGVYVRSAPGDFGLDRIFDQGIAQLKREETDTRMVKAYEERYAWFVGAASLLLAFEAMLSETGLRRVRRGGTA